ncbi:hypothetical protein TorRG33x02_204830 [Trema orientale]|uniref:Uncharacterized protein n=1 Tax=Trema orientale TaxID=63057 RepID=A0A2P5EDQ9_TREOI|nr:hypothetical protein TorRG33x02_204830 [Trema orientale]
MAKALLLMVLCLLPALATASHPVKDPLKVKVPSAGYGKPSGADVRMECRERKTIDLVYSKEASTNSSGTYKILISEDHVDEV